MKIEIAGLQSTILALRGLGVKIDPVARKTAKSMGDVLIAKARENMSQTSHSLSSLADKDHPYARRHKSIQGSILGGRFTKQPYLVHTRSGQMLSSLSGKVITGTGKVGYEVSVSGAHATFVVRGTKHMLRRDVLVDTANMRTTKKMMVRAAITTLSTLRAGAVIRGFRIRNLPSATEK